MMLQTFYIRHFNAIMPQRWQRSELRKSLQAEQPEFLKEIMSGDSTILKMTVMEIHLKKYYFQTKINTVTAPIGERDISFMLTTDGGDTWIERIIEANTTLGISECDGMHLGGGNYMAFVRIDGGGAWRVWKTTDSWITKSFLGNCTLRCSWGGSYEKIMRFYPNDWDGTWNIKITERDTYWECRSVGNNPIVDGSFTNLANLKQMHLWYYNKSGSHRTIGYGDCQFPAAGLSWETVMKEMDTNTECKVMYTEDDNIDTVSAPTPTLFSTFITGSSFAVFIDMDAMTEAQRQNFRLDPVWLIHRSGTYNPCIWSIPAICWSSKYSKYSRANSLCEFRIPFTRNLLRED
jgi:hypothetical protein